MAFLLARGGRRQDALYELDKILEKDPNHAFANRDAGQILGSMGRMKDCIPHFERSLATFKGQQPQDLGAIRMLHQMLATAYNNLRDAPRTKFHLDAYKKLEEQLDKDK
jgi:tetratricopeptide (TPR) repeat protein